jgi:hypothetical protein
MQAREYGLPDDYWGTYPGDGSKIDGVLAKQDPFEKYEAESWRVE